MGFYPAKVLQLIDSRSHAGVAADAVAGATEASLLCGSFVSVSMHIDDMASTMTEIRYRTNGCGFAVAACEALARSMEGKQLTDLNGGVLDSTNATVFGESTGASIERSGCVTLAENAVRSALADYREKRLDEYRGEVALVCSCFGVSEDTIESCITENGLTTVEDVIDHCRAGGGCGSCQPLVQEMLDDFAATGL